MFRRTLALTVAVFTATAFAAAGAGSATPPLRTLVYQTAYSTAMLRHEQTSGFTHTGDTMGSVAGSGGVDRRFTSDEHGTVTVAVVAATSDGGLVVDTAYAGQSRAHPAVRVAIFKAGGLSYDPKTPLAGEEMRILPYLARGFVAERTIAPGESWSVPQNAPASGTTTYRIMHVVDERATIGVDGSISLGGPAGFDEHQTGTAVYATDVLSPLSLDLRTHVRKGVTPEQDDTIDAHLIATLVRDSFAKR